MNLFAYGTLMCEDILQDVTGCAPEGIPAILSGYARKPVRGEEYPALVPDAGRRVSGTVFLDLPVAAWDRLDRFEGEMYERREIAALLDDGSTINATTYVIAPGQEHCLEEADWNFAEFLRGGKERFVDEYKGYSAL